MIILDSNASDEEKNIALENIKNRMRYALSKRTEAWKNNVWKSNSDLNSSENATTPFQIKLIEIEDEEYLPIPEEEVKDVTPEDIINELDGNIQAEEYIRLIYAYIDIKPLRFQIATCFRDNNTWSSEDSERYCTHVIRHLLDNKSNQFYWYKALILSVNNELKYGGEIKLNHKIEFIDYLTRYFMFPKTDKEVCIAESHKNLLAKIIDNTHVPVDMLAASLMEEVSTIEEIDVML